MSASKFFSESFFKANTPVSESVDYQDITPFIEVAQDTIIKSRIGKKLYERLSDAIENKDWNTDELELIKLCRMPAMYHTIYLALPFLQTKIRNKGLVKGTDQYIQTVSRQDQLDLRSEFNQMTGFYMEKLNEWLCLYSSKFPEYADPDPLNDKNHVQPFDFGGFFVYKGLESGGDWDLIKKMIDYKRY